MEIVEIDWYIRVIDAHMFRMLALLSIPNLLLIDLIEHTCDEFIIHLDG